MKKNFAIIVCMLLFAACQNNPSGKASAVLEEHQGKTRVYYFHGNQRCVSCLTLQEVSKEAIARHFASNPDVVFVEVDFSDAANRALSEKYEIVFSSLVIASDTQHTNLTEEAFSLVRNPDRLRERIIEETEKYLNL